MLLFGNHLSPAEAIGIVIGVLIGMTVHEFAHNYVAHLMGDPVPARTGKLTLDPTAHIYWPGFIMFVLIGFGILGTAPIAAYRMRNPRWGYMLAVAAGPFSNLLVAITFGIPLRLLLSSDNIPISIFELLSMIVFFNILLFLFNLIPLFPIDGWHIVLALLPPDLADTWQRNRETSQYVLLGLIIWSFVANSMGLSHLNILNLLISEPANTIWRTLLF